MAGIRGAAKAHTIKVRSLESGLSFADGLAEAAQLPVKEGGPKLGVVAASEWVALGLHTGLLVRGARVREQVTIVSLAGLPLSVDPSVRICSLIPPVDVIAQDAVAELRRLAAAPVPSGRQISYPLRVAS